MVANQTEAGDSELFQLEWATPAGASPVPGGDSQTAKWRIRTAHDKLWRPAVESAGGVQAAQPDPSCVFF